MADRIEHAAVADRLGVPPILMESRENLVQRDVGTSLRSATYFLVNSVGDDPVDPGALGRIAPE